MTKKMAAHSTGGWVLPPPIRRDEAEKQFGAPIPAGAWAKINVAYGRHGQNADALSVSRLNKDKKDKLSWSHYSNQAQWRLDKSMELLSGIDRNFLYEVDENICLKRSDGTASLDLVKSLSDAFDKIGFVSDYVRIAKPDEIEVPTDSESRKSLARDIFEALEPHGARVSDGRALGKLRGVSEADLTGYERLLSLFGVHVAATPIALSKWVREAMEQKSG